MAQFITRIELRGQPPEADYDRLHALMEVAGFSRTIQGYDGQRYRLPTAMYVSWAESTAIGVRDLASSVAAQIGHPYWTLTVRADDIAWNTELLPVANALAPLTLGMGQNPYLDPGMGIMWNYLTGPTADGENALRGLINSGR
jgi:hypothetical protein